MNSWINKIQLTAKSKRNQKIAAACLGVFIVANLLAGAIYHGRTLPHTNVNSKSVSGTKFSEVNDQLSKYNLLPNKIDLYYKDKTATYKTKDLGISIDEKQIIDSSKQRSWLPLAGLLSTHQLPLAVKLDQAKFNQQLQSIQNTFKRDPQNAEIIIGNGSFKIKPDAVGYRITPESIKKSLHNSQQVARGRVELQAQILQPQVKQSKLQPKLQVLQKQQKTPVTFHFQSKSKKLTPAEITSIYEKSGDTYVVSDKLARSKVVSIGSEFGIRLQNGDEAVEAIKDSLGKNEALDFTLVQLIQTKTFSYCVQLKGVDGGNQAAFESKLASTYADTRGWSLGGQIKFAQVSSGCNFTVWLAAADLLPGFGPICDTTWSCTVSPNVIINYDRWANASQAWNDAGGNLEDYRAMVINHETGHWLGFGHKYCSGAGQQAPVMQQQSIGLQGCTFNPWPLASETNALRSWLGL